MSPARPSEAAPLPPARARWAWAFYDWAGNGFATVIISFVFSAYFTRSVAASPEAGTSQWGTALAISGVAVALGAPVAGAVADRGGPVKPWLAITTLVCAVATAGLWFVTPQASHAWLAVALVGIGNLAFELGNAFYNSMLPRLAPPRRVGRLSGRGWALGYAGGLTALVLALYGFVRAEPPPLGLDSDASEHIRILGPLVALWLVLFAVPLFALTPDRARSSLSASEALRAGLGQLAGTLREARAHVDTLRFLLARMLYVDGLATMFAFGGVYAAGTFGMDVAAVIMFGIALNVAAGLGAFAGGWVDDTLGPKRTVLIALFGLIACGVPLLVVESVTLFWVFGVPLGLFMGPVQAASRSMMARFAPPGMESQMFGMFATSGKITAFAGPALVAWVTDLADSQRYGMATIVAFFVAGALLLLFVAEPRRSESNVPARD